MFPETEDYVLSEEQKDNASGTKSFLYDFSKGDFVIRDGKLVPCDSLEASAQRKTDSQSMTAPNTAVILRI